MSSISERLPEDRMSVVLAFRENMPNRHEQFAGSRCYRFVLANPFGKRLKLDAPIKRPTDCRPGRHNQGRAQLSPSLFANLARAMRLSRIVNPCAETGSRPAGARSESA